MIDFSAIETEIAALITAAATFTSSNTGRIRETLPISSMPAVDVSATGHVHEQPGVNARYRIPMMAVIRSYGTDRNDNASEFKELVEAACGALEHETGSNFDIIRDITSTIGDATNGEAGSVRVAVITFTARKG